MVVGIITCGGVVLGQGAKVLSGSTQGIYPRHKEVEDVGQQERQGDKREDEERDEGRSRRDQKQRSQCA